ncbi:MAG: beta-N-acetylglucosaminidase domain-containing protein [Kiritimatiellae bacterium]|nr:beta-N-acetylglucosaminidase domain-containing protein [Kiritimatiellia bacterium]
MKIQRILFVFLLAACPAILRADNPDAVRERLKNDPFMIPFYTGKILPFPVEATYHDEFFPLADTGILLGKDLAIDDSRLKLLLNRISQYGGNFKVVDSLDNDCTTIFAAGETTAVEMPQPPARSQGYAIKCFKKNGKNIAAFAGHDRLGLTWAVNSLVQMITLREDKTILHAVDVCDYPFMVNRGGKDSGISRRVDVVKIYPVTTKLDWLNFDRSALIPGPEAPGDRTGWRKPAPQQLADRIAAIGTNLQGLGIKWEVSVLPFAVKAADNVDAQLSCKSDEDFNLVWQMCEPVLKAGGGICYNINEFRFPIHADDKSAFGSAGKADVHFINRLHQKIKASYPGATMSIVQPFYYGPRTFYYVPGIPITWFDESPVEYLKAIGEGLPGDIYVYWTGTQVKTSRFTKQDVDRMTAMVKRKPLFLQNSTESCHMYGYVYPTDSIDWWMHDGRDTNVYVELAGALFASQGLYADMLWSAMLWNPNAFNAKDAAYQATCKLVGPENYAVAGKLAETLAYFDRYFGGKELNASYKAARDIEEIEKHILEARKLSGEYENNTAHPSAVKYWASLSGQLEILGNFCSAIMERKQFDLYRAAADQKKLAQKEAELRDSDVFIAACDFGGGDLAYASFALTDDKRPAMILSGRKTIATAEFVIPEGSGAQEFELLLCGKNGNDIAENIGGTDSRQDGRIVGDGKIGKAKLMVYLNGKEIFAGSPPFASMEWELKSFPVSGVALKDKQNSFLAVRIIDDAEEKDPNFQHSSAPVFSINYAVVRSKGKGN